jgi:hypothetical protein
MDSFFYLLSKLERATAFERIIDVSPRCLSITGRIEHDCVWVYGEWH